MNEATALLSQALAILPLPILLGIRALRKKFALDPKTNNLPELVLMGLMAACSMGLAYAQATLNAAAGVALSSVVDLWWVQGMLFFFGLVVADVGVDATSIKTASAERKIDAMRIVPFLIAGGLALSAVPAAAAPDMLSLERLAFGPKAVAQVYDFDSAQEQPDGTMLKRELGFIVGAGAGYNLTSRWDLNAALERKFNAGELVPPHWRGSAGAHVLLPNSSSRQQWFLGVERAWYRYSDEDASRPEPAEPGKWTDGEWVVRLQWSFGAQDAAGHDKGFAIVRARYDVGRSRDVGVGVQPQLFGGELEPASTPAP